MDQLGEVVLVVEVGQERDVRRRPDRRPEEPEPQGRFCITRQAKLQSAWTLSGGVYQAIPPILGHPRGAVDVDGPEVVRVGAAKSGGRGVGVGRIRSGRSYYG